MQPVTGGDATVQVAIQNVVSTTNLGTPLNLKEIAMQARNTEYNPKRFAAVVMRIREPRTTALLFASGKMVCTGSKSEDCAKLATKKFIKILQKMQYPVRDRNNFCVQNIVGSVDTGFSVRVEGIAFEHANFCTYEPEIFPGLIYRMMRPHVVLLIFVSGKVVLTGAKTRHDIYAAVRNILPVMQRHRRA